jgi:hypothetical protein
MYARIAWAFAAISVVCAALDTAVTAAYRPLMSQETWAQHGWPLATLATVGAGVMGALIISRHARHPIGWLLIAASTSSISLATEAYSIWVLHNDGPGPLWLGHVAGWGSVLCGGPLAVAAVTLICLIAPDGHLMSRRWRWPARGAVVGLGLYIVGVFSVSPIHFDLSSDQQLGAVTAMLTGIGILMIAPALVAAAIGLVLRLLRAEGEVRRQLLWVASSAGFMAAGFVFLLTMQVITRGDQTLLSSTPLFAAYLSFPICTAVAILRHRLFDIDVIVNRALVVIVASSLVAAGYVVIVVATGAAVGDGAGGFWPSLLATALVAAAFQPLRRRVVRVADRLAFGASAAPYDALADFSRRLGESPDPTVLLAAFADAAGTAVNARRATALLRVPGARDRVETWSAPGTSASGAVEDFPVTEAGEPLGALSVEMPGGRALRPRDTRLLRDLADQAAIAFRNARLSAEVTLRVEQLNQRTVELTESRSRLITAADAERSRLERAIAQDVLSQLDEIPAQLQRLASGTSVEPARLEPLVAASTTALDALREITRGVFPAQLERFGLESAIGSLLTRTGSGQLVVDPSAVGVRFDPSVEAAAYFCVAEASRDLGGGIRVALAVVDGTVRVILEGNRTGPLDVAGFRDRVEAVGGAIRVVPGSRTLLEVTLPARSAVGVPA